MQQATGQHEMYTSLGSTLDCRVARGSTFTDEIQISKAAGARVCKATRERASSAGHSPGWKSSLLPPSTPTAVYRRRCGSALRSLRVSAQATPFGRPESRQGGSAMCVGQQRTRWHRRRG